MKDILCVYKPLGRTPLEMVNKVKEIFTDYKSKKIGYAGRLDPMAEGVLLLLVGVQNKKRKIYENLPKEYEFDVLFGVSTDSYDVLGIVTSSTQVPKNVLKKIEKISTSFIGKWEQEYPPYSSARVGGKPLYYWARVGEISRIKIPKKMIEVYALLYNKTTYVAKETLKSNIYKKISLPAGEFRQKEIKDKWESFFNKDTASEYAIATFSVSCSSGTYVRSIANEMGKNIGIPSLAFRIVRKSVGKYSQKSCLDLGI